MRSASVAPDLSSASSRVSETVSTANFSGTNCLALVDAGPYSRRIRASGPTVQADSTPALQLRAAKVLQLAIVPALKPVLNQRWRCSDVPWVKLSGTT